MTANIGSTDRLVRASAGLVSLVAAYLVGLGSALGIVLVVLGAVLIGTATFRFCPLYRVLGVSTCPTTRGN